MRENDIFGVKPLKELLEIIKEQINDSFDKIMRKQYEDFTKYDKNVQKRKESDLDNIYKEYIKKKRKISELSEGMI
jgi:transcription termination factor NusB